MPFFNQDIFDLAQTIKLDPNFVDPNFGLSYNQALKIDHDAGVNGIDAALSQFQLDAVVSATDNPPGPLTCSTATNSSSEPQVWPRPPAIRLCRSRRGLSLVRHSG